MKIVQCLLDYLEYIVGINIEGRQILRTNEMCKKEKKEKMAITIKHQ